MAFTGGGEVIGEASIEISPEVNLARFQAAATQMVREFERLTKGIQLQGATRQVQQLTTATQQATRSAAEARAQFVELAIGLEVVGRTLTQFVTVPLTRFLISAVNEASHFNEVVQQTNVILGESADEAVHWAETLSASFGLTNSEALESQNNFALLFNEIGVGMEGSVEIAQQLVERIGDLASFKDMPIEQVIQRIQSGLVGETEAVRRLGIILDESVIKQKAYEQGIISTGEALSTQQKFLLRAQQILEQSSEAQGDAARTANTYAGQLRELRANSSDLREEIGNAFIPAFTTLLTQFNNILGPLSEMARGFSELDGPIQEIVLAFLGLVAALGPFAIAGGRLVVLFKTIGTFGGTVAAQALRNLAAQMAATTAASSLLQRSLLLTARALPFIGAGIAVFTAVSAIMGRTKDRTEELNEAITVLKENIQESPSEAAAEFLGLNADLLNNASQRLSELSLQIFETNQGWRDNTDIMADGIVTTRELAQRKLQITNLEKEQKTIQDSLNGSLTTFNQLVQQGEFALAESIIAQVTDVQLKKQLQGLLNEGLKLKRQDIILNQRDSAITEALTAATRSQAEIEEDHLSVLKDIASELKQRASLENQRLRAIEAVTKAQERLNEATEDVRSAQQEYNDLVAAGTLNLEEIARAEDRLTDARERATDALEALQEAQTPADADDLAEAEDAILRAELGLRDVRRENKRAVDELNKSLQKTNQIQRISLNLAGLSLDQIRSAVGNARASAEALRQKTEVTEEDNEVQKTAEELADEAIERGLSERDAIRAIGDARERLTNLRKQGTAEDERVIEAAERYAEAQREVIAAEEEARQARLPDQALVDAIAAAHQRVLDAIKAQNAAQQDVLQADRDRVITLKDIAIELAFINGNEQQINEALVARYGLNEQLAEQQRRFANERRQAAVQQASGLLNSLDFNNFGALGRNIAKATFTSPALINTLANLLINSPGAPLRELLKRIGVPDSLLTGFKDGGVITRPMVANIGEGYKAEAVVPLTNARNAIAALQKGWGYMAPALKQQLAPALAPKLTQRPQAGFSMSHGQGTRRGTPELQTLQAILARLNAEDLGTTNIQAPITLSAPNSDLAARKIERQLRKLQNANRGRPDARMR